MAEASAALAALVGGQRALLAASTLHVFWDVFGALVDRRMALFWDEGSYPVARWGVERAAARGVTARSFAHHSPEALARQVARGARTGRRPVVVTDGYCPGCGALAPIDAYLEVIRAHRGLLILDDTQAVGMLGTPAPGMPYGAGGGGSLRWSGLQKPEVLWCGSMAKALGVPLAGVVGSEELIGRLEARGETRMHCSPPSVATLHAAAHALEVNARDGDALRAALGRRVGHFRTWLRRAGMSAVGGLFPVQRLGAVDGVDPRELHARLSQRGVRTVLQRSRCGPEVSVSFVFTARHGVEEVEQAVEALEEALHGRRKPGRESGPRASEEWWHERLVRSRR
ncbi:aminotransferase class I/II-fold pyridoxal phosphate-dependent enzyme [Myxococcus sp. RHSTA-1-4]|uniref:aminotransferase class I/II-fold pyridoxal phosphate-dependent enzyme n=1 Tax=Myxococcus sp. RHSTA-1-4 TaxID=2874601 RepID=UPI001CBCAA1C|nr:aminotransferase class I/II-fold pyridoxal phosphate-dependent enzyme [Myxococcus sp. RHSTA-1-4]MBZ4422185.1 aminotransferase class I/II-fold pyridoxal phosphate-dependent enzyme [Myxococcus sp. RHSTA-1-4]